ncbi:MAG TPA: outer membrane beta-barrel protein [Pyrinomonadaceae bacterium]|nr:outer membrane beta-barrel protein [Pyrinomonadaceae bacterium]
MRKKTRRGIHLVAISFALFASLVLSARPAIAQDQVSASPNPCECWIDVKTGGKVPTAPLSGINISGVIGAEGTPQDPGIAMIGGDRKTAFNTRTKQNFALEPDGCWIDVKTGEKVPTAPLSGINISGVIGAEGTPQDPGIAMISSDRKTAFNTRTKQNFAREPCPLTEKKVIEKKKEVCDIEFGYDYMRAPDESAKNLNGFGGSLFCNVKPWIGIGGDFGSLFGSTTDTVGTTKIDVSLHRQTYLFGPQFNFYPNDKVKVFVHPLFGGVHDSTKTTIGTTTTDSAASAFAMAFGGGVDINLNNRFAVRPIQFDFVPTHFGGAWQNNYQISTGIVVRLGKKK